MKYSAPVISQVDVIVIGGTLAGVNMALQLQAQGLSVFLASLYTYLGEDVCAYLDLQTDRHPELAALFPDCPAPTPLQVKLKLEDALLDAGISFLYQTFPVRLAESSDGAFAGVLFGNRSGFQIVAAKAIYDASEEQLTANLAHLPRKPFKPGPRQVERIFLQPAADTRLPDGCEILPHTFTCPDGTLCNYVRASAEFTFAGNTTADYHRAEIDMRTRFWSPGMSVGADRCRMHLQNALSISFRPSPSMPFFFADSTVSAADIAAMAAELPEPQPASCRQDEAGASSEYQVVRLDGGPRFQERPSVAVELNGFPCLGQYQVLVVGGGTGGAPAAIAAGRAGAKTLCLESTSALGGLCTQGRIGSYWYGNRVGFCRELDEGVTAMAENPKYPVEATRKDTEWKRHWLLREGDRAGVEYRFQHLVIAAVKRGNQVCGAVVASPWGTGIILAQHIVDATGNADLAAAGGADLAAETFEPAVQGAGLPPIIPGQDYTNTDYTFIDDSDVFDLSRAFVQARHKFAGNYDVAQIADTRERRRIVGEVVLQPQDFYAGRQYGDTITIARSNFDTHGYIVSPMFMLEPTSEEPHFAHVPFRALLPRGLEGILVTGLAVSAHRDCLPLIRMQPDVHNQGYAAGLAAAQAAADRTPLRSLDLRKLQQQLLACQILTPEILRQDDYVPPLPPDAPHARIAAIFLDPPQALPRLRENFAVSPTLLDAQILAFLGDAAGAQMLAETVAASDWDDGWNYRGMGQFGRSVSPLDCHMLALANVGSFPALFADKLRTLTPDHAFSHFRTICLVYLRYPQKTAAAGLERLLDAPGMSGHAIGSYHAAIAANRSTVNDNSVRNAQLKELYLAKALLACQPDHSRAAEILQEYAEGMQGVYARFARAPLPG